MILCEAAAHAAPKQCCEKLLLQGEGVCARGKKRRAWGTPAAAAAAAGFCFCCRRLRDENLLPLADVLQREYLQMFKSMTKQIICHVASLKNRDFFNLEELLETYKKIAYVYLHATLHLHAQQTPVLGL